MANDSTDNPLDDLVLPDSLDQVRISGLPSAAYYISDFITEEEEQSILEKIQSAPKPRWKQLTHRRLQTWPSDLVNNKLMDAPLPTWLNEPIVPRLKSIRLTKDTDSSDIFVDSPHQKPNHVLINGTYRSINCVEVRCFFVTLISQVLLYCQPTPENLPESSALIACHIPHREHGSFKM